MKKIYIAILVLVLAATTNAQNVILQSSKTKSSTISKPNNLLMARSASNCQNLIKDSVITEGLNKEVFYYDVANKEIASVGYHYDSFNNFWRKSDSTLHVYNNMGQLSGKIIYTYIDTTKSFTLKYKDVYTIDSTGQRKYESFVWAADKWIIQSIYSVKYNTKNLEIFTLVQDSYNEVSGKFREEYVLDSIYTSTNKDSLVYSYFERGTLSDSKIILTYTYDTYENVILEKNYRFNTTGLSFVNYSDYNNKNLITQRISYEGEYEDTTNYTYEYNECDMLLKETENDQYITNYYYSENIPVGLNDESFESNFFYPNPAISKLNFTESSHYQMINSQGVPVISADDSEADISFLPPGIYFIKLGSRISKFVKE
jgi:hypothetical protein